VDSTVLIVTLCVAAVLLSLLLFLKMRHVYFCIFHSEFAALQIPAPALAEATSWYAILPAGTGFGMSLRVRPGDGGRPRAAVSPPASSAPSFARGNSLVLRAQALEEQIAEREGFFPAPLGRRAE
jgi:hypothetical protein